MLLKEVKFISHFSRNFYLYFLFYLTYSIISPHSIKPGTFFIGLIAYVFAYSPIYFFNDFADRKIDPALGKANLYLAFNNPLLFLLTAVMIFGVGLVTSLIANPYSLIALLILYLINMIYSFPPTRLRDKIFLRELSIFLIYSVKFVLVSQYLHFKLSDLPIPILLMASSTAAFNVSLYKRYVQESKIAEYFFGLLFLISWLATIFLYRNLTWLYLPLLPAAIFMFIFYQKRPIPLGLYQTIYFLYSLGFWILSLSKRPY